MTQLRQDPTTKEWVIVAAERSKRPHDFIKTKPLVEKPLYKEDNLWVRPLKMFLEEVEIDGKKMPRFRYLGN